MCTILVYSFGDVLKCRSDDAESLQHQVHFNVINHWGQTLKLQRELTVIWLVGSSETLFFLSLVLHNI